MVSAFRIEQGVAGYSEQPTRERTAFIELMEVRKGLHKSVLSKIFDQVIRGAEDTEKNEKLGEMATDEIFGRGTRTAPDGLDEIDIRSILGQIDQLNQETSENPAIAVDRGGTLRRIVT